MEEEPKPIDVDWEEFLKNCEKDCEPTKLDRILGYAPLALSAVFSIGASIVSCKLFSRSVAKRVVKELDERDEAK